MAAPARQLGGVERVEAPVGRKHQTLATWSRPQNANSSRSSALKAMASRSVTVAAQRADPALLRDHDGDRLALDQGLLDGRHRRARALRAKPVRRLPSAVFGPNFSRTALISSAIRFHCSFSEPISSFKALRSSRRSLSSLTDLHLLELAQVAQPHVEDGVGLHLGQLEGPHQHGLGLVLGADDLDDLVEVEIGDQIAAQHLQPMVDLGQAEIGAAHQHLAPVVEPLAEHLRQPHHLRYLPLGPARSC